MATILYSDVSATERLPVDAQDVVTKVQLVVAGGRAGPYPDQETTVIVGGGAVDHMPEPIVFEYEAPEHATYGCTRAFALPEGVDPFLPPTDALIPEPSAMNITNPGSPSAVRDGDPLTYAEFTGQAQSRLVYELGDSSWAYKVAGFKLRYSMTGSSAALASRLNQRVYMQQWHYTPPPDAEARILSQRRYDLTATSTLEDLRDVYAVTMWDARGAVENRSEDLVKAALIELQMLPFASASWRVHEFYPLVLDEDLLLSIAQDQVRLPALIPQRVTVDGPPVAADVEHTIVGWPGGDFTGRVSQQQYQLGRTIIDFEQAGALVGLRADSAEAVRERRVAIDSAVATASYSVRMGERQ